MTRLVIHRNLTATAPGHLGSHQGMAHFAGTGPVGATCGGCVNYTKDGQRRAHICAAARRLGSFSKQHIPAEALACRHFEARATQ